MKNKILYTFLISTASLLWSSCCDEDDFSKDYDINFPVATIETASAETPFIETVVTLTGSNFSTATSISIDSYNFAIGKVSDDETTVEITVPRVVTAGLLKVTNKYGRVFQSDVYLAPRFHAVSNVIFPSEIQVGRTFMLEGDNVDLISEVTVGGVAVSLVGVPEPNQAIYTIKDLNVKEGDNVEIVITPKNGGDQISGFASIVKASDAFIPKSTLLILDTNLDYIIERGDDYTSATVNENATGLFGKALRVSAPVGNAWNGTYLKILSDNGGKGFDLSNYNDPHITMLVNTHGIQGYMQPVYTIDGSLNDVHLYNNIYGDDYMQKTEGWEWRSYSLEALGFKVTTGFIENIGVQFRGGNIGNNDNGLPFDISVNKVMITDGALNPYLVWDCESPIDAMGDFVLRSSSEGGLTGVNEGSKYAHFSKPFSGSWSWLTDFSVDVPGFTGNEYTNGLWMNILVNTGNNVGNFQLEYGHDGGLEWLNLLAEHGHGDDYTINPTNGNWEWRSMRFGNDSRFKKDQPFYVKIGATTGNWAEGIFELNVDYLIITTAPLDTDLNTDNYK